MNSFILDRLKGMECEMEALFREFFFSKSPLAMLARRAWQPSTDVYETEENIVVLMEIPGVKPAELEVTLTTEVLQVCGCRADPGEGQKLRVTQMEIHYGPFERRVRLHRPIDRDQASVHYRDGFLEVTLPKARQAVVVEKVSHIKVS